MITIFEKNCTDFSGNGLGVLTPDRCEVYEALGGAYQLTLTHPMDEAGKWRRIALQRILRVPVPASRPALLAQQQGNSVRLVYQAAAQDGRDLPLRSAPNANAPVLCRYPTGEKLLLIETHDAQWWRMADAAGRAGYAPAADLSYAGEGAVMEDQPAEREQPFRIYKILPGDGRITVYARHIFYDLADNMVIDCQLEDATGATALQAVLDAAESPHFFCGYSDLTGVTASHEFSLKSPSECLLGAEGVLETWGGELLRDWYDVYLLSALGEDRGVTIRRGKNLTALGGEMDDSGVATRILPVGQNAQGKPLYLPEKYVDSALISAYPHPHFATLNVTDARVSSRMSANQAYTRMRAAAQALLDAGCDRTHATLDAQFIDLSQTDAYENTARLQKLCLGDSVRLIDEWSGVDAQLRVCEYVYDALARRYLSVSLGGVRCAVEDVALSGRQIALGAVGGTRLGMGAVDGCNLADGAVGTAHIGLAVIGTAQIADAAITSAKIGQAAIGQAHISNAAVGTAQIETGAITTALIGTEAVGTAQIADGSITDAKVVSLTANRIAGGTLDAGTVNVVNLNADNITAGTLNGQRIPVLGEDKIEDGAISGVKIQDGAVVSGKLGQYAVTADKIVSGAVTTDKLAAQSVTANKIVSGAVTTDKLAAGSVTAVQLAAGSVTAEKIDAGAITADAIAAGAITADKLAAGSIAAGELRDVAVSSNMYWKLSSQQMGGFQLGAVGGTTEQLFLDVYRSNDRLGHIGAAIATDADGDDLRALLIEGDAAYAALMKRLQTNGSYDPVVEINGHLCPPGSGLFYLGGSDYRWRGAFLQTNPNISSDAREKQDIADCDAEALLYALRPCRFRRRDDPGRLHWGFVAQQAQEALHSLGMDDAALVDAQNPDALSIAYGELIAPLVEAMQRQQRRIEALEAQIVHLTARIQQEEEQI